MLEILRLSEKLVDHQLKIIRFTLMTQFSTVGQAILVFIHVVRPARILLQINVVQCFILRLERGNRVTEHLDCYKIELIQNYHN